MRPRTATLLALTLALLAISLVALAEPAKAATIKAVKYTFEVEKLTKVKYKSKKYGALNVEVTMEFKLSGVDRSFTVLLGVPFLDPSKYKGALKPELVKAEAIVDGKNIVRSAKLITKGVTRVELEFSEPLGDRTAYVRVTVKGTLKSTSKLYATKDYKLYKDYKPINGKILYVDIINFYESVTWSTDKKGGETIPGLRVVVLSPKGWRIFYARSSLSTKLRYMEIKKISEVDDRHMVEFWYLSTSSVLPTKFSPGKVFSIEVGFQPLSDYRSGPACTLGILLFIVAAFFAYYYRDVWRYVEKKVA